MSVVLGVLILLYIVWYLLNPEAEIDDRTARRLAWPAGLGGGILVGTTGIGAPVIATYVHSLRLARSGVGCPVQAYNQHCQQDQMYQNRKDNSAKVVQEDSDHDPPAGAAHG